jgi:hypothetical protein
MTIRRSVWVKAMLAAGMMLTSAAVMAQAETPAGIVAAHIRTQGYTCAPPLGATRNRQASKPNEAVWILRCKNAVYRVRLIPDMAARVTRVR